MEEIEYLFICFILIFILLLLLLKIKKYSKRIKKNVNSKIQSNIYPIENNFYYKISPMKNNYTPGFISGVPTPIKSMVVDSNIINNNKSNKFISGVPSPV